MCIYKIQVQTGRHRTPDMKRFRCELRITQLLSQFVPLNPQDFSCAKEMLNSNV